MPFELRVTPGEGVARLRAWGNHDYRSTQESLARVAADPGLAPGMPVLFDLRELDYLATPPEVASFASDEMPALYVGRRVALLARRGTQQGICRAFATKASQAGAAVEVFAEPDIALAWLRTER
ncbi:MAG TPA: hypothetical protein VH854_07835 [Thermoanaerobaculia bacterium]|nr:hypothetical protein [Thermoanaerobaculia bacterium]